MHTLVSQAMLSLRRLRLLRQGLKQDRLLSRAGIAYISTLVSQEAVKIWRLLEGDDKEAILDLKVWSNMRSVDWVVEGLRTVHEMCSP